MRWWNLWIGSLTRCVLSQSAIAGHTSLAMKFCGSGSDCLRPCFLYADYSMASGLKLRLWVCRRRYSVFSIVDSEYAKSPKPMLSLPGRGISQRWKSAWWNNKQHQESKQHGRECQRQTSCLHEHKEACFIKLLQLGSTPHECEEIPQVKGWSQERPQPVGTAYRQAVARIHRPAGVIWTLGQRHERASCINFAHKSENSTAFYAAQEGVAFCCFLGFLNIKLVFLKHAKKTTATEQISLCGSCFFMIYIFYQIFLPTHWPDGHRSVWLLYRHRGIRSWYKYASYQWLDYEYWLGFH